jgi:hypothetical protein
VSLGIGRVPCRELGEKTELEEMDFRRKESKEGLWGW